jgi:hypothetical protein
MIKNIDPVGQQEILAHAEAREAISFKLESGVNDYMSLKAKITEAVVIVNQLVDFINNSAPQFGTGSPEGVVTANNSQVYYDTSVAPVIMYVNQSIGADTGWQEVQ